MRRAIARTGRGREKTAEEDRQAPATHGKARHGPERAFEVGVLALYFVQVPRGLPQAAVQVGRVIKPQAAAQVQGQAEGIAAHHADRGKAKFHAATAAVAVGQQQVGRNEIVAGHAQVPRQPGQNPDPLAASKSTGGLIHGSVCADDRIKKLERLPVLQRRVRLIHVTEHRAIERAAPIVSNEGQVLIRLRRPAQDPPRARTFDNFPIEPFRDDCFVGGGGFVQMRAQPVPGDLSGVHH